MKKIKFVQDRQQINSDIIEKKEDIENVFKGTKSLRRRATIKTVIFSIGLATVLVLSLFTYYSKNSFYSNTLEAGLSKDKIHSLVISKKINVQQKLTENRSFSVDEMNPNVKSTRIKNISIADVDGKTRHKSLVARKSKHVTESSAVKIITVPNIDGIYSGTIKVSELLKAHIIESGGSEQIDSYMVGYFNGTTDVMEFVSGNQLSEKLKNDLVQYNTGEIVFFTEMYTSDNPEKKRMLPPINLRIVPN
jgi:hypothetical protein